MESNRFRVEFIDKDAKEQFLSLPKSAQLMIGKAIKERLEIDPISFGKPLRYSLTGCRRLRVSTYRVVYKVDINQRVVILLAIDHRKDVYE